MDSAEAGVKDLGSQLVDELRIDPNAFLRFYQYLRSQYCLESINFFLEAEEYASLPQPQRAVKEASLAKRYIDDGAPQQVNINHKLRQEVLKNVGSGKAQIFTSASNQVVKLMKLNIWYDFQKSSEWAITKKAKPLTGKKALRKAFIKVIDEDVYPAAVFVFTGKHISKQEIVQLKMENEFKEWLLDNSNESVGAVLHNALESDLDIAALQGIFHLLSTRPKILFNFLLTTTNSAIRGVPDYGSSGDEEKSDDASSESGDDEDHVKKVTKVKEADKEKLSTSNRGRNAKSSDRVRSPSPVTARIFPAGGVALTIIEEFLLYVGGPWLRKVLKKIIPLIYKQDSFTDTVMITRFSSLPKDEQKRLESQAALNRDLVCDMAESVLEAVFAKETSVPHPVLQVLQEAFGAEKATFPDLADNILLHQGPGRFIIRVLSLVIGTPTKLFDFKDLSIRDGATNRRTAVAVIETLQSLIDDLESITVHPLVVKMHEKFRSGNVERFNAFLKRLLEAEAKEKAAKAKAKEISVNVNVVGHYLTSNGNDILKRFNPKQLGVLKDFLQTNADKKANVADDQSDDLAMPQWFPAESQVKLGRSPSTMLNFFAANFRPPDSDREGRPSAKDSKKAESHSPKSKSKVLVQDEHSMKKSNPEKRSRSHSPEEKRHRIEKESDDHEVKADSRKGEHAKLDETTKKVEIRVEPAKAEPSSSKDAAIKESVSETLSSTE